MLLLTGLTRRLVLKYPESVCRIWICTVNPYVDTVLVDVIIPDIMNLRIQQTILGCAIGCVLHQNRQFEIQLHFAMKWDFAAANLLERERAWGCTVVEDLKVYKWNEITFLLFRWDWLWLRFYTFLLGKIIMIDTDINYIWIIYHTGFLHQILCAALSKSVWNPYWCAKKPWGSRNNNPNVPVKM